MSAFHPYGKSKKNRRVKLSHREDIEPHEIFLDKIARKHEEKLDIAEKKIETPLPKKAVLFPFAAAVFLFLLFFARVVQLQIMHGSEYSAQAEGNKYIYYKVQADRGIIFDKDYKALVENLSTFDLVCDPAKMPATENQRKRMLESIGKIVKMDEQKLAEAVKNPQEPVLKNLDHQTLIILEARISDFPGCEINKRPIRKYTGDASLSHLLGYMGKIEPEEWKAHNDFYSIYDYIGRTGLENTYENILRKNPGQLRIERDAKGKIVSKDVYSLPESGKSIVLWLDLDLQKKIKEEMEKQLKSLGLERASAVAIDPKTGGILATASFPNFDNNVFSEGKAEDVAKLFGDSLKPLFNRPIQGQYLTGSTIKPLTAAAALQEKIIKPDKDIDCQGKLVVQNVYDPEIVYTYNDNHVHGLTDMRKAIAESCNAYFQTIGGGYGSQQGLGPTRIKRYLELFGWGSPTGIDLPDEKNGFIPDPEWKKSYFENKQDKVWTDGDTYNMSIGQGFLGITPLQVANSFAAIANGGTLYRPQIVKQVVDERRNVIEDRKPAALRENFLDADNLKVVREGMRQAVTGWNSPLASSVILNSLPVPAAAKTGTAQLKKDKDGKDLLNSWVTVFAPYDDPRIVVTIMMEDVHEGQFAVLPVAQRVLNWYFGPRTPESANDETRNVETQNGEDSNNEIPAERENDAIVPGDAQDLIPLLDLDGEISPAKPEE